jgi:IMP cyclohydrolase
VYVGRIVVVGKSEKPFVAYRVSSRSFPNRTARIDGKTVSIGPIDQADLEKNPYIAYNCIRVSDKAVVVSNGSHTDPIFDRVVAGECPDVALQTVLAEMGYEKDEFNTPRIAGVVVDDVGYLGIVRDDAVEVTSFNLEDGLCRFICTYELNRVSGAAYPFIAETADEAARYVVDGGPFKDFGHPVCSAAWFGTLAVYNPHH